MKANIDGIAYPRAAGSAANAAGAAKSAGLAASAAAESMIGAARPAETAGAANGVSGAAKHEITREEALERFTAEVQKGLNSEKWYTFEEFERNLGEWENEYRSLKRGAR